MAKIHDLWAWTLWVRALKMPHDLKRKRELVSCQVAPGDYSPGAPTDPGMRIFRIRLVKSRLRDP
jgi:hypothetical protein